MPNKVYNNVVDHRVIDNGRVIEDVTSITPPSLSHPTTTVSASGMAVDVDVPTMARLDAMEYGIAHNNGVNCKYLRDPGKHMTEGRVARQRYNVTAGENEYESVKFRMIGLYKGTDKGTIERNNPYGSTEKYSVLRYEEEIDGEIVTLIDAMAGIIQINGVDYTSPVENLLK